MNNQRVLEQPAATAGLWAQLRRLLRLALVLLMIVYGLLLTLLLGAFWWPHSRRVSRAKQHWCRGFLRVIGVQMTVTGKPQPGSVFLVSNHVSWLDIPLISSRRHSYFLSKAEVRDWPIIGWFAVAVGTLFIKRGSGESGQKAKEIAARLQRGHSVLVFPEGTTTDGGGVRSFYPQLFEAPLLAGSAVQPLAIRYLDNQGAPDRALAFIGDDEFHHHLWAMLLRPSIRVRLHFCTPLACVETDRGRLSEQARARIVEQIKGRDPATPALAS